MTLTFDGEVPVGPAKLEISFAGEINNQMAGFYRSQVRQLTLTLT